MILPGQAVTVGTQAASRLPKNSDLGGLIPILTMVALPDGILTCQSSRLTADIFDLYVDPRLTNRSGLRPAGKFFHRPNRNRYLTEPYNTNPICFLSPLDPRSLRRSRIPAICLIIPWSWFVPPDVGILPDPIRFLRPIRTHHTSNLTSKRSACNLNFCAVVKQHNGFLVFDLSYILDLLKLIFRRKLLPIPARLPWTVIEFHHHKGYSIFVQPFYTLYQRNKCRSTTYKSDR